jgi:hypothetical protein
VGFKDSRRRAIECLKNGLFYAEDRIDNPDKNLLAKGLVTPVEVIEILKMCDGNMYEERPLDQRASLTVHIFKTPIWYIKLYFIDPNCNVISVHKHD